MFYGKAAEQPLSLLRKMIVSHDASERCGALDELFPFVRKDIKATLEVMDGLPVTARLLDPPRHEFGPNRHDEREKLANALGITAEELAKRAEDLHESNPMMGHRGVRLGVTFLARVATRLAELSAERWTRFGRVRTSCRPNGGPAEAAFHPYVAEVIWSGVSGREVPARR
jgi:phosphoenolpyruvate synthase/pyruvate phosphate dikinase